MTTQLSYTDVESGIVDADHRIAASTSNRIVCNRDAVENSVVASNLQTVDSLLMIQIPYIYLSHPITRHQHLLDLATPSHA